jgi:hypothetical protein
MHSTNAAVITGSPLVTIEIPLTLSPAFTPPKPYEQSRWSLSYGNDKIHFGDILRFRLFEDGVADVPILDFTHDGTHEMNGFFGLYGQSEHFQDLQGLLVLDLYAGSVTIDRFFAETYVNSQRYAFSKVLDINIVPEPSASIMLVIGGSFLLLRRRPPRVAQSTRNARQTGVLPACRSNSTTPGDCNF